MVDGKVVSALTNKNTTQCTIYDKSGHEMAKNEGPFTAVSEEKLEFGASPLHFGLRAFEALLHIGYKQDVKAFRAKKEDKQTVKDQIAAVKEAFKRELGLVVDQRREGGFGTTNTGNVARKAFAMLKKLHLFVVCQQCWSQTLMLFAAHWHQEKKFILKNLKLFAAKLLMNTCQQ
jgi:hypothetical protein